MNDYDEVAQFLLERIYINKKYIYLYMFFAGVFAIEMYSMPSKWAAVTKLGWFIGLWGEGYHRRCRVFDKSMDGTIASDPILIVRILPGQQVMVHSINSVKIDDSFYLFFIHSMILQALSDMSAT